MSLGKDENVQSPLRQHSRGCRPLSSRSRKTIEANLWVIYTSVAAPPAILLALEASWSYTRQPGSVDAAAEGVKPLTALINGLCFAVSPSM